jgi:hypothetical protein
MPPEPPVVPLLMVLPAWPPLTAPASCVMVFRPELLHASPIREAANRADRTLFSSSTVGGIASRKAFPPIAARARREDGGFCN